MSEVEEKPVIFDSSVDSKLEQLAIRLFKEGFDLAHIENITGLPTGELIKIKNSI